MSISEETRRASVRRLGADLRWFLEQCGVNPEAEDTTVMIVLGSAKDRDSVVRGFRRAGAEVRPTSDIGTSYAVLHGVKVAATVRV